MAVDATFRETITIEGRTFVNRTTVSGDGQIIKSVSVPAAKAGTLTTRTDDETGTLTMGSGHGITTGAIIDLYWTGGARRGITVGTVSGTSVPIGADDAGAGDVLPAADTAITASTRTNEAFAVTGNNVVAIVFSSDLRGTFVMAGSDDAEDLGAVVGGASEEDRCYVWESTRNGTNPIAGDDITQLFLSNSDSTNAATMNVVAVTS